MWERGERRLSFAGKTGSDSVVHTHPYIALTPHPTGRDADGRMLFLTPDAGKALLLVLRYSFEAGGGASFTFTLVAM